MSYTFDGRLFARFPSQHESPRTMNCTPELLAYIGPETILPASSILAGLGGLLLIFGNYIRGALRRCVQRVTGRKPQANEPAGPDDAESMREARGRDADAADEVPEEVEV